MDLKNFKPVAQDEKSYTVKHPCGKLLFVDKANLAPEAHKAILHLFAGAQVDPGSSTDISNMGGGDPMAPFTGVKPGGISDEQISAMGGGDPMAHFKAPAQPAPAQDDAIEEDPVSTNGFTRNSANLISPKDKAAIDAIRAKEGPVSGDADYVPTGKTPEQAVAEAQSSMQGRAPDSVPQDPILAQKSGMGDLLQGRINDQQAALDATQKTGEDVAKVHEGEASALGQLPTQNDIVAQYQAKDQQLAKAYADAKIDPEHFLHNMSTGSKILTGIGMVLSGMGSATTGQPSYAMQVINDAIKRDVEAQAANKSDKLNLWKMNREAMGNDQAANLATENQIKAGALAKLQAAQTRAALPVEKLRIQSAISDLQQSMLNNNMIRGVLTQGQMAAGQKGAPALSKADPALVVNDFVKDPEQRKIVLNEIKARQNIAVNGKAMLEAFDQAAKEVSGLGGVAHAGMELTPGQLKLKQLMQPNMDLLDGTVRQAAVDSAEHTIVPGWRDFGRKEFLDSKRATLLGWMHSQSSAPTSKSNALDLDRFESTAIPSFAAPAAGAEPQYKTVKGVLYMRGPNGEAIPVKKVK